MSEASHDKLRGVLAAALTPLKGDLSPDHAAMIEHFRWLLTRGCDGVAVLGTTGEANSFSLGERLEILEALGASGLDPGRLIVGAGCCAMPDTVRLTTAALALGAAGVLVLPPFYYKGVSEDGLFAAYAEIIERVGDNDLRIYLYHFPRMTGIDMSLGLIERLAAAYPGTVVGIKDSSGDWPNTEAICRALPQFRVFAGSEQFLLPTLRAGGAGCISATTNVTCHLAAKLYRRWRGPEADALQEELTRVRLLVQRLPLIPALKQVMAERQGRPGWLNMRPPLMRLDEDQARGLLAELEDAGFILPAAA